MTLINDYAPLLLRICLVVLFPFSGLDKIINWNSAMKQAGNIPFKPAMLVVSIIVEFGTPVCIVAGGHDRLFALLFGGGFGVKAGGFSPLLGVQRRRGHAAFLGIPEELRPGRRPRPHRAGAADSAGQRGRTASTRLHPCDWVSARQPGRAGALIPQAQAGAAD